MKGKKAVKKKAADTNQKRKKVVFCANFPDARAVCLVGDFNEWNDRKHPMKKNTEGRWEKYLLLYPGTYEYKFTVDGRWANDAENSLVCTNSFGTSNNFIVV
ncbi:MAG: glycogen-binding domain-containing protein [Desulfobacterales bacterium]